MAPEVRLALVARWRSNGLAEHASVASFSRHSLQLLALAAPADLVEASHRAAIDEVAHAKVGGCLMTPSIVMVVWLGGQGSQGNGATPS